MSGVNKIGNSYWHAVQENGRIKVNTTAIPRGKPVYIPPAWGANLREGLKIETISPTARLLNGQLTGEANVGQELGSAVIGKVNLYDQAGKVTGSFIVPLEMAGHLLDLAKRANETIEISPSTSKKLTVIERRMEAKGLPDDASAHIYTLTDAGAARLMDAVVDLSWITDVTILEDKKVKITYEPAGKAAESVVLDGQLFIDNFKKPLLANQKVRLTSPADIYQSPAYTDETKKFAPWIDRYNGNLRLIVEKVRRYEIDAPAEVTARIEAGEQVKVFPSTVAAAIKVDGQWLPLNTSDPLTHLAKIDRELSQTYDGIIKSVIGPQTRLGNKGEVSGSYPRDPYFYGLTVFMEFKLLEEYGEDFAINRSKALIYSDMVSQARGIQSGRTHTMPYTMIFDPLFADVMDTNNQYYKKLSNYAHWLWGPGVSEDCQMEIASWMMGVRMHVLKEMVALMPAEKEWGRYKVQNGERYNYSEELFRLPFRLALKDAYQSLRGGQPVFMGWEVISEIAAGRTWYKLPFAKMIETAAIPAFLVSLGHTLFFPVDLTYFMIAWGARLVASGVNYALHLISLGYGEWKGIKTGFSYNPAMEFTFNATYLKGAIRQFLDRNQYGTFVATVSGGGAAVPKENKKLIWTYATATVASLGWAVASLALVGIMPQIALPLGLAIISNFLFGGYNLFLLGRSLRLMGEASKIDEKVNKKNPKYDPNFFKNLRQFRVESPADYQKYIDVEKGISFDKNYDELFALRDQLNELLLKYKGIDKKGGIAFGYLNPHRDILNQMMEARTAIEMTICVKTMRELQQERGSTTAHAALKKLLDVTREFVVIDTAAKSYRRIMSGQGLPN